MLDNRRIKKSHQREDGVWMYEIRSNYYINEISAIKLGYIQ